MTTRDDKGHSKMKLNSLFRATASSVRSVFTTTVPRPRSRHTGDIVPAATSSPEEARTGEQLQPTDILAFEALSTIPFCDTHEDVVSENNPKSMPRQSTPDTEARNLFPKILPDALTPQEAIKKVAWTALKQCLFVLKDVSVVFPPLQAAVSAIVGVLERIEEIADARNELATIIDRLTALAALIHRYAGRMNDDDIVDRLSGMAEAITQARLGIEARLSPGFGNVITNLPDARDILQYIRALSFLLAIFEIETTLNTEARVAEIKNAVSYLHDSHLLDKLSPIPGSSYDDIGGSGECLPGTRVGVLSELMAWASDPDAPSIYLLTGMAGTGKSAIARSFARLLDDTGILGASFFCSRSSDSRSNVAAILPSLAFHLAYHSDHFATELIRVIKAAPGVSFPHRTAKFQFTTLITKPSEALTDDHPVMVIVLDALDECAGAHTVQELLGVFLRTNSNPARLKFFITSRPEPHIERAFTPEVIARRLRLHDIENSVVTADIEKYLKKNLAGIGQRITAPEWPTKGEVAGLLTRAGHLFIFAFTAIQYLSDETLSRAEVQTRLHTVISPSSVATLQSATIDGLYTQIVHAAWTGKEPNEKAIRQDALATILCLREPLCLSAVSYLLGHDPETLAYALADFHSVLDVPRSREKPILVFHASFHEYLTTPARAGVNALDTRGQHAILALRCIKCMNSMLRRNIGGISRGDSTASIGFNALKDRIPLHLRYASIYWASHLSLASVGGEPPGLINELEVWANTNLLHWLECLSLIGSLHAAIDCTEAAILFLSHQKHPKIQLLLHEVQRLLPHIFPFASKYPLEVYFSALVWLPTESTIREIYWRRPDRHVLAGLEERWSPCEQVLRQRTDSPCCAFSLDNIYLATSQRLGKDILIWRVQTGEIYRRLLYRTTWAVSLTFSPDTTSLAIGCQDRTVEIWSVSTGEVRRKLVGHRGPVCSVAFSPDGSRVSSASVDRTVRIWGVESGQVERVCMGHSDVVTCLTYSPDGSRLFSGSADLTIRMWARGTGGHLQLAGHTKEIVSVACSPDGTLLASGAGDTIRIWDIGSGQTTTTFAYRDTGYNPVTSVVFILNTFLGCSFYAGTVRVLDISTGGMVRELLPAPHSNTSVTLAADGHRFAASAREGVIKIWNLINGELGTKPYAHSQWVWSVGFSLDKGHIVSRARDEVRFWNTETGALSRYSSR
ncbi:hypothetical protein C8R46DRAFT_993588 [Mycena filopes]|nr:hypothetical protein C8R46DRAFT_993588 [Mycena filopes]